jgi:hypothetical protein
LGWVLGAVLVASVSGLIQSFLRGLGNQ